MQKIEVTSSSFGEGEMIPAKYTCEGQDISPPITWGDVPGETKSLALIADDPDAPGGTWVHWVVFNIPHTSNGLPENLPARERLDNGVVHGINDFKKIGYGGPCPPSGTHRYYFKLYALSERLDLDPGATKQELLDAMEGKALAEGKLMGKYGRD